eukprot:GILI01026419.1.p1 GENE.GILI01026419.1~~GILI01026419.1.p1  ORF type:complete len:192 (+),score=58.79 GILI01026419.1:72-578(+)
MFASPPTSYSSYPTSSSPFFPYNQSPFSVNPNTGANPNSSAMNPSPSSMNPTATSSSVGGDAAKRLAAMNAPFTLGAGNNNYPSSASSFPGVMHGSTSPAPKAAESGGEHMEEDGGESEQEEDAEMRQQISTLTDAYLSSLGPGASVSPQASFLLSQLAALRPSGRYQ